jgi:hypothetical protein
MKLNKEMIKALSNFGVTIEQAGESLRTAIERAKHNMDKIKNVDEFINEVKGDFK